uniref:Uncharacterized protein n=1 Tax=Arundo donax TaxID=35708 RepID=A0A0A8XNL6_ARUDO
MSSPPRRRRGGRLRWRPQWPPSPSPSHVRRLQARRGDSAGTMCNRRPPQPPPARAHDVQPRRTALGSGRSRPPPLSVEPAAARPRRRRHRLNHDTRRRRTRRIWQRGADVHGR